jgi:YaiO family outer membrane protein
MILEARGKGCRRTAVAVTLGVVLAVAVLASAPAAQAQQLIASTNPAKLAAEVLSAISSAPPAPDSAPTVPTTATLTLEATAPAAPMPQQDSTAAPVTPAPLPPPAAPRPFLGRFEVSQWGTSVSNGFGNWYGGGLHLFLDPAPKVSLLGEFFYEHRPDETEQAGVFGATIHLNKWFYVNLTASGGGPDNSAAFIPQFRYDLTGTLATPLRGFLVTGGWTRLQYGNPVSGRIIRAGFIQYAGKVVLQGTVNFNNTRPGNHKSVDGVGAIQIGQEEHYWLGVVAGGGTEAWQTIGLFPSSVQFDGYHLSFFARKWLTRRFGVVFQYNYLIKHTAYHSNGGEFRFFWQF